MEIRMDQLIQLSQIYEKIKDMEMPLVVSYNLSKLYDIIANETEFYYKALSQIINKYSEKDSNNKPLVSDDKQSVILKKDKINECENDIKELNELKVEIPKINLKLNDVEGLSLSIKEAKALSILIEE